MRFRRIAALVLVLPLSMAACTGGGEPSAKHPASSTATTPSQMLVLDRGSGVVAIDPSTGSLVFQRTDMTPLPDWSKAFTASASGGSTDVREIDPATGTTLTSVQVHGSYDVGAVAADGDAVALVPPAPPGGEPWTPVDRSSTSIVVAHPGDPSGSSERYRLHGNYAPEAFSTDGSGLLMLQYLPAVDPVSYRVVRLELDKGKVEDLYGRTKGAQPMATNVSKGWLQASHREKDLRRTTELRPFYTHTNPQPLTPGEIYRFDVEMLPTAYVFKRGHRIRLEIANGDSPLTDAVFTHPYPPTAIGTDTIHHHGAYQSCLMLPVVKERP